MKRVVELCTQAARTLLGWIFSFALWSLWLALVLLLALQVYILTAHELAVPGVVLRQLESRLAESGLRASFRKTSFDPSGDVLIEDAQLSLPAFEEPVLAVRSVFVRLNPWMLIVGRFEPSEIRLVDAAIAAPAMVSPTGRPENLVRDLHATVVPSSRALVLREANAQIAGVMVSARGTIPLRPSLEKRPPEVVASALGAQFSALCRQAIELKDELARLEDPSVRLEFAPSESGAIAINVSVHARAGRIEQPFLASATGLRASTRILLFGEAPASHLQVSAAEVRLPGDTVVRGLHAAIAGRIAPGRMKFELREIAATVDSIATQGIAAQGISARLYPRPLPHLEAHVVGRVAGSNVSAQADVDLAERSGVVRFDADLAPQVLDVLSQRFKVDVRRFFDFDTFRLQRGEVTFARHGAFEKLTGVATIPVVRAYGVTMKDGRAAVELYPTRFHSPEAFARIGENFARGTYDHDLKTQQYRFLLDGRLRPLEIGAWFREWWQNFFQQLAFPAVPPGASVDVSGFWREGRRSSVFVFADVPKATVRGTELDRVRTRLFIRPGFFDIMELFATHGEGTINGRFTYTLDPTNFVWRALEFDVDSTFDFGTARQLLGPGLDKVLAPFKVANAPEVSVKGSLHGPAAVGGSRENLRVQARARGPFSYYNFPLENVSFVTKLDGDQITIEDFEGNVGGGLAKGRAQLSGPANEKKLGFDFSLRDASLGQVSAALSEFFAAQEQRPAAPPGKFVQEKAGLLVDIAASAEGRYGAPTSFRGQGNAALRGAELGQLPLLGLLSELLKFTTLRFNDARASFKIEGSKLAFHEVTLRGANSAIDAHGDYHLTRRELDFNAKIFPFQESDSLIKSVVGAVLTPLSNALEVKLTGTIDKPEWSFAKGPGNLLRSLAPSDPGAAKAAEPAAPATPPSTGGKP